ncbi:MAG TPA: fibronectin type III domain-containing protein, partial [Bacillota bacterium]|nr:fibronectin type III domain-containing protein [Bacillota bacterium]
MTGRIVFTSGGHGWAWTGSSWALGRPVLNAMNEDYGNLDQMTLFAFYCFNAGATVVPLRPVGHQTNEVVLDNTSAAVSWNGSWMESASTVYYGQPGAVPYRYATVSPTETATATYTPNIPVAGFYPVYCWALSGSNRTNQLYRINHTGGQSLVRVPHHMVGNGWVYLGTYYFNGGASAATGSVVISNLGEGTNVTGVVIADAIRFGNGMGDVDRGGGVSTYPREEECARYWVQRSLGQGQSSSLYDNPSLSDSDDNVGAPIRMAAEMNRESAGNLFKRVYISFHSNAGGSRGVSGLYNNESLFPGTSTSNQFRLAQLVGAEVNSDLVGIGSPPLEVPWYNASSVTFARSDYAFGEIRGDVLNYEMDATIVEVAYHDDVSDAKLLRDPKARNWIARAAYQGLLRYLNQFDGVPLNFLPEPPVNVRAMADTNTIVVSWAPPLTQGGSSAPTGYIVYQSTDGYGFGNPVVVTGGGTTSLAFTNLATDTDYYFRVAALNAGGESCPSETVGCRRASSLLSSRILLVNGFTRFDRTLNLRQTPIARQYKPPGHDANSGTMERVLPRRVNAFDYAVPHGKAISSASLMGFDSCQVQAVTNTLVKLANYQIVIWQSGNQSTADRTFNNVAQTKISAFLAGGGHLFVSGAEIAWDLDRASGPSTADRNFLHTQLHASLRNDTNDDSGVFTFTPAPGSLFSGNAAASFDDGSKGIYWVGYPDALTPIGTGASAALNYPGYSGGAAAIRYDGSA